MQKSTRVLLYALSGAIIASAVGLSSCSKDDDPEPEVKPQLSFAETELTVNEDEGSIDVELVLDKPASEDVTIEYELSGSAQDLETISQESPYADYGIAEDYLEIEIPEGETSVKIHITVLPDFLIEDPETINIEITDVDSDNIEISRDDEAEITLEQEQNGVFVELWWDETYTSVDMDLLLRVANLGQDVTTQNVAWGSTNGSKTPGTIANPAEAIFIPASVNAIFGLSYTYYEGDEDPMNFSVAFAEVVNGQIQPVDERTIYEGTYGLDNINKWTQPTINSTKVVQTFEVEDGEFSNFTEITEPATGSRIRTPDNASPPVIINKGHGTTSLQKLQSIFQKRHL